MSISLFSAVTATGAQSKLDRNAARTVQVSGKTTSGTGAATVNIEVSNDGNNWLNLGTITLTIGTTETSDGFAFDATWAYVRGNVTSISGTGASVSGYIS